MDGGAVAAPFLGLLGVPCQSPSAGNGALTVTLGTTVAVKMKYQKYITVMQMAMGVTASNKDNCLPPKRQLCVSDDQSIKAPLLRAQRLAAWRRKPPHDITTSTLND
ncbi:hypothetical protein MHYP_G00298230 [Metynnis hypsauchen]